MSNKMGIKKGDTVVVIAGKDGQKQSRKTGKVLAVFPDKQKVVVEGVNLVQKHRKPRNMNDQGGIVSQESPIHISNVMIYCKSCKTGVRTGMEIKENGNKVRVCKKCRTELDK